MLAASADLKACRRRAAVGRHSRNERCLIKADGHLVCDDLETASPALHPVPESSLDRSDDPETRTGRRGVFDQFLRRIPQRDGQDVDASSGLLAANREEIANQTRPRIERAHFGRGGQAATENCKIEVHDGAFPGKAGGDGHRRAGV